MRTLHDYVRMVSESMYVNLNEEQIRRVSKKLLNSKKYNEMLLELEKMILAEKRK